MPERPVRPWLPIFLVSALAFVLRAAFALWLPVVPANSDPTAYVTFASSLVAGHGFGWGPDALTAFWPPGPSAMYAGLFLVFGEALWLIAASHVLIGTASVAVTMWLASHLHSVRIAVIAGLLMAVWPVLIQFTTIPSSEPVFTLLVLLTVLAWGNQRTPIWRRGLLAGSLCALASLARPTGLLLGGVLAFAELVRDRSLIRPMISALLVGGLTLILLLPWAYRNQHVFGRAFLTSSSGSANAWLGNHTRQLPPGEMWPPEIRGMSEVERADYLAAEVRAFIRSQPMEYVRRCIVRFFRVHERESIGVVWNDRSFEAVGIGPRGQMAIKVGTNLFYWPVLLLSLSGLVIFTRQRGALAVLSHPLALLWLYFATVHAFTVVQDRYHFPSIPAMAVFAAVTLDSLLPRRSITETSPPSAP